MNHLRAGLLAAACAAGIALTGCGGRSHADMLNSAKASLAKGERQTAIVELKGALQADGKSAEARFLLGRTLLELGDPVAAMLELRKAGEQKYSDEALVPVLARALVELRKPGEVVERYATLKLQDPTGNAELKTNLALSYAMQGKLDIAQAEIDNALASRANYPRALLLRARIMAAGGDGDGAIKLIDTVIAADKASVDALLTRGELLYEVKGDPKSAAEAYRTVLQLRKDNVAAHAGLHGALMQMNDLPGTEAHHKQMAEVLPNHPLTRFYAAQLAFLRNDFVGAKELVLQLLKFNPEEPKLLQLAGMVAMQQGAWLQAESYLKKAIPSAPEPRFPTRLLAQTYLSSGQAAKALEALRPLLDKRDTDGATSALAAEAYLQNGDVARAEEYFRRAAELRPGDTKVRTALALSRLAKGDPDGAFGQLEKIASTSKDDFADLALITARLMRQEFDPALKAIDALERKDSKRPLAAHMRGRVLMLKGDVAGARSAFEAALVIDPKFYSAVAAMAGLELRENKPDLARKRFEDLLKQDPNNVQATLALAEILQGKASTAPQAMKMVADVIAKKSSEPSPRLWLVEFHLKRRDFQQALQVAQEGVAALPEDVDVVDMLGRAQLASGDANQAIANFKKVAVMLPRSTEPLLRMSDAYVALRDYPAAIRALRRALDISPRSMSAHRGLIKLSMRAGKRDEALAHARSMQKDKALAPMGHLFEGDIELARRNFDAAAAAYRAGLQLAELPEMAVKLHSALNSAGKRADADKLAAGWLEAHPKDVTFLFHMGGIALAARDYEASASYFDRVIAGAPDNALALNNVAWLKYKLKRPGALEAAQRANALLPNAPALMDTLAIILADNNKVAEALVVQRKALELRPKDDGLKLGLAKLLAQQGDVTAARQALSEISKLVDGTPVGDEAAALSEKLAAKK